MDDPDFLHTKGLGRPKDPELIGEVREAFKDQDDPSCIMYAYDDDDAGRLS